MPTSTRQHLYLFLDPYNTTCWCVVSPLRDYLFFIIIIVSNNFCSYTGFVITMSWKGTATVWFCALGSGKQVLAGQTDYIVQLRDQHYLDIEDTDILFE